MALIKKALLYAGWIPALFGGGATLWWLESDKTIGDVLKKSGRIFLSAKSDFQKLYETFELDNEFIEDIKDVENKKGEGVADWYKEKLDLPITKENLVDVLPKAEKYCLGDRTLARGSKSFKKFRDVFTKIKEVGVKLENRVDLRIAHLGEDATKDVYYCEKEDEWKLCDKGDRKNLGKIQLFINSSHKILSRTNPVRNGDYGKWKQILEKYRKNTKGDVFNVGIGRESRNATLVSAISLKCSELLKPYYVSGSKEYTEAEEKFISFCTETGLK